MSAQSLKQLPAFPQVKRGTGTLGVGIQLSSIQCGQAQPCPPPCLKLKKPVALELRPQQKQPREGSGTRPPSEVFGTPSRAWPVGLSALFCPLDCLPVSLALLDCSPVGFLGNQYRVSKFHSLVWAFAVQMCLLSVRGLAPGKQIAPLVAVHAACHLYSFLLLPSLGVVQMSQCGQLGGTYPPVSPASWVQNTV